MDRPDPTTDPVLATYFLFHDCDLATLRWALTTLRASLPRSFYTTPPGPLPRDAGRTVTAIGSMLKLHRTPVHLPSDTGAADS